MPILSVHFYLFLFQLPWLPATAVVCSPLLPFFLHPFFLHPPPSCILFLQPYLVTPTTFLSISLELSMGLSPSPNFLSLWSLPTPPQPTQLTPSNSHYFRRSANSPVVHLLSKVYHTEWQENTLTKTHLSQYNSSFIFLKLCAFF